MPKRLLVVQTNSGRPGRSKISDTTVAAAAHYAGPLGTGSACQSPGTESNVLGNYMANSGNEHHCVLYVIHENKSFRTKDGFFFYCIVRTENIKTI